MERSTPGTALRPPPGPGPAPTCPSSVHKTQQGQDPAPAWDPGSLAGRLVEIVSGRPASPPRRDLEFGGATPSLWGRPSPTPRGAGSAALTAGASLVWKAQQRGEPVAWINARASSFFPPDLHAGGIDVGALVVVRVPGASSAARAADKLLRSGAFGLVVLDVGAHAAVPAPLLSRLLGLAQKHHAAVVFLTEKTGDAASLAPLVSLRVVASRTRIAATRFACTVEAIKDKRHAPGWKVEEAFGGPPGLR